MVKRPAARPLSVLDGTQPALSKISHTWRKVYWVGDTDSRVEPVLYPEKFVLVTELSV